MLTVIVSDTSPGSTGVDSCALAARAIVIIVGRGCSPPLSLIETIRLMWSPAAFAYSSPRARAGANQISGPNFRVDAADAAIDEARASSIAASAASTRKFGPLI
jgi:hypothetical protein